MTYYTQFLEIDGWITKLKEERRVFAQNGLDICMYCHTYFVVGDVYMLKMLFGSKLLYFPWKENMALASILVAANSVLHSYLYNM